jgi:hypothetical protein
LTTVQACCRLQGQLVDNTRYKRCNPPKRLHALALTPHTPVLSLSLPRAHAHTPGDSGATRRLLALPHPCRRRGYRQRWKRDLPLPCSSRIRASRCCEECSRDVAPGCIASTRARASAGSGILRINAS